jgi:hypothetical protein
MDLSNWVLTTIATGENVAQHMPGKTFLSRRVKAVECFGL